MPCTPNQSGTRKLSTGRWRACASAHVQSCLPARSSSSAQQSRQATLHSGNTRPSWVLTNLPSNWRIQHCNHMAQRWSPQVHTRLPVDRGNLCHEPCSTTPFSARSIPPANSQIHQHNCMGRPGRVAWSASLVARRAQRVAVQWEGSRGGGLGNTMLSCQLPRCSQSPLRN